MSITPEHATLWGPLRIPLFRDVFIADLVSDIGTFMQSVGAAWLMVSLGADATMVALTQTASALPFFLFALPAGAIGDIVDRRNGRNGDCPVSELVVSDWPALTVCMAAWMSESAAVDLMGMIKS